MNVMLMVWGIVLLAAAAVGGGFKAAGVEVPLVSSRSRQLLLAVVGVGALVAAFVTSQLDAGSQPPIAAPSEPVSPPTQAGPPPSLSTNPPDPTTTYIDPATSQSAVPQPSTPPSPSASATEPSPSRPVQSPPPPKPTITNGAPPIVVGLQNRDGRREEFWRGSECALWHRWQVRPGGAWSGPARLGGCLTSDVAGAANADGRLEIFARGTDNALWHIWQKRPNSGWSTWSRI
jgi:hypothetical protein